MRASRTTASIFGEEHFGGAQLGDQRRRKRLVGLADQMAKHPGGTLPDKLKEPADLRALYRLMDCDAVTHESGLRPHVLHTLDRMRAHEGVVLVLHDTTELDYSGLSSLIFGSELTSATGADGATSATTAWRWRPSRVRSWD
jgi:hypothetical protein